MPSEILVLSADTVRSTAWAAAFKNHGLRTRVSEFWPEANQLLLARQASVVLHDDDEWIAPVVKVLSVANNVGTPVIVVARDFDAAKWMRFFRSGAFDVLRHSTEQHQLCESVEAALNNSLSTNNHPSWRRALLEWTRSKFHFRTPGDSVEARENDSRFQ